MYYLIIQLFRTEYKEDVLLALTSCGIDRGNTFEGQNLDKILHRDFPLFTGFIKSEDERERFSLQISSVVTKKEQVEEFVEILKEADIDITREDILRIVLLPAEQVVDSETNWRRNR